MLTIGLVACSGPALDPTSREPQPVRAPFGDVVALLPSPEGPILVTEGGAVRLGDRITPVEPPPVPRAAAPGPGEPFLMGFSGDVAVGGGPGPHGDWDGRVVAGGREVWVGGPEWEVLHALAPFDGGWLAAGVGVDRKGAVEVEGAVWVVSLDASLATRWERRFYSGQDHVVAVVGLGDRAVVLALGGHWDDPVKPLSGWVVRADGTASPLVADLGRVRSAAATASGPGRILLAGTDPAVHPFVRWVDVP